MVRETRGVSKLCITVVAEDSNLRECARWTNHEIASRLVADVRDVAFTRLAAAITNVLFGHGTDKLSYDVMSFDLFVKYIVILGESTCPANIISSQLRPR